MNIAHKVENKKHYISSYSHTTIFSIIYFVNLATWGVHCCSLNVKIKTLWISLKSSLTTLLSMQKLFLLQRRILLPVWLYPFRPFSSCLQTKITWCSFLPLCVLLMLYGRYYSVNCLSHSPVWLRNLSI